MIYTKISLAIYAIALLVFILFAYSPTSNNMGTEFRNGLLLMATEFILLISAVIFSVLAAVKEKGLISKIPLVILLLIGTMILLSVWFANRPRPPINNNKPGKEELHLENLSAISVQINKNLPKMINEKLRLDSAVRIGKDICFIYTLLDADSISAYDFRKMVILDPDSNPEALFENKINAYYSVVDKEGNHITGFTSKNNK